MIDMVLYICDKKKDCNGNCGECKHTDEIQHAKNFKLEGDDFVEIDNKDSIKEYLKNVSGYELYTILTENVKYEELLKCIYSINKDFMFALGDKK